MAEEVNPFPKSEQLARGPKRQRRIVATKEEWAAIAEAKQGPCRICRRAESNGSVHTTIEFHHLIRRSQGRRRRGGQHRAVVRSVSPQAARRQARVGAASVDGC